MNLYFPDLDRWFPVAEGTRLDAAYGAAGYPLDRVCGGNGSCGRCRVTIEDDSGRREVLACQTLAAEGLRLYLPDAPGTPQLLRAPTACHPTKLRAHACRYGAACDLGTTSVALTLFDLTSGQPLAAASALNAQTAVAADVIGRLEAALRPEGAADLQHKAVQTINALVDDVCGQVGLTATDVGVLTLAGNSVMVHLLLGYPVSGLAASPYTCHDPSSQVRPGADLGLRIGGTVETLPLIGSFVGADTVAAALAAGLDKPGRRRLLIDLGTNGELMLTDGVRTLATSAAAGPAMEGAGISCGMRGTAGAIEHVRIADGTVHVQVIGGGTATGICGSGLVDLAAELVKEGSVTPQGKLDSPFPIANGVSLTPEDIRALQLSKGAIGAAIELLLRAADMEPESLSEILLAGAFGNYIRVDSAQAIGLLPDFGVPVTPIGNAALLGAQLYLLEEDSRSAAAELARQTRLVELAHDPDFSMVFAMHMSLTPMRGVGEDWED